MGRNVPDNSDFADDDWTPASSSDDDYCEDDDLHARGGSVPHDDGGEPVEQESPPPAGEESANERQASKSAEYFDPPAEAMKRDLQAMIDALDQDQISESEVPDRLGELRAKRMPRRARHVSDVAASAMSLMDERAEGRQQPVKTPWPDFNEQLPGGGFWPGAHLFVSGTGMQKTTAVLAIALQHARTGGPVLYAGLEIEDEQAYLRLAAAIADVRWSALLSGEATGKQRAAVRAVADELNQLPIHFEPDEPTGWCVSRLRTAAAEMRAKYENQPLLVVVDFLQIIAAEPDESRDDLRERIGKAAYAARHLARRQAVTVLLVSSVAREAYAKVNGLDALCAAGIGADCQGAIVVERFLRTPEAIVGLGKESGEIEFSADTVTVAMALPRATKDESRRVVLALPKVRLGPAGWCSVLTDGHRFLADPSRGADVLKAIEAHSAKKRERRDKPHEAGGSAAQSSKRKEWAGSYDELRNRD